MTKVEVGLNEIIPFVRCQWCRQFGIRSLCMSLLRDMKISEGDIEIVKTKIITYNSSSFQSKLA